MIDRRKRAGSFVAQPRLHSMVLDVPDLPTEVRERGESYSYQLLRRSLRFPSPGNVREETLASRGLLLELEGVHSANNSPLAFEHRQVSVAAVPAMADADFSAEPPGSWLLRNVPWTEAETRISATSATAELAEKLHIDKGAACLSLERWTWRGGDQITFVQQSFVGTRYDLIARFGYGGR
jgi:GntR family histidine utilization transcriptional repressor